VRNQVKQSHLADNAKAIRLANCFICRSITLIGSEIENVASFRKTLRPRNLYGVQCYEHLDCSVVCAQIWKTGEVYAHLARVYFTNTAFVSQYSSQSSKAHTVWLNGFILLFVKEVPVRKMHTHFWNVWTTGCCPEPAVNLPVWFPVDRLAQKSRSECDLFVWPSARMWSARHQKCHFVSSRRRILRRVLTVNGARGSMSKFVLLCFPEIKQSLILQRCAPVWDEYFSTETYLLSVWFAPARDLPRGYRLNSVQFCKATPSSERSG